MEHKNTTTISEWFYHKLKLSFLQTGGLKVQNHKKEIHNIILQNNVRTITIHTTIKKILLNK